MGKTLKAPQPVSAASEVISLATARLHLRLDAAGSPPSHPDDALVNVLISAARESAERYTALTIGAQILEVCLDDFPVGAIDLQTWPVSSIQSITYVSESGEVLTLLAGQYTLDNQQAPAVVYPVDAWPRAKAQPNSVKVRFVAGFTDGQSPNSRPTPKPLIQAMLLTIGHLYEHRQDVTEKKTVELPLGSIHLMQPYRIGQGV